MASEASSEPSSRVSPGVSPRASRVYPAPAAASATALVTTAPAAFPVPLSNLTIAGDPDTVFNLMATPVNNATARIRICMSILLFVFFGMIIVGIILLGAPKRCPSSFNGYACYEAPCETDDGYMSDCSCGDYYCRSKHTSPHVFVGAILLGVGVVGFIVAGLTLCFTKYSDTFVVAVQPVPAPGQVFYAQSAYPQETHS